MKHAPRTHPAQAKENQRSIMNTITKDQFVAILDDAGITETQKHKLHGLFEARHPQAHDAFLKWLGLPPDAIRAIREKSRQLA